MSNRFLFSRLVLGLAAAIAIAAGGLATAASATPGAAPVAFPGARTVAADGGPGDALPATPIIAVVPQALDFGSCVLVGQCSNLVLRVSNGASDPNSMLVVTSVQVTGAEFNLQSGPQLPISLPGDGTSHADFTIRFCPTGGPKFGTDRSSQGTVRVTAQEALNSPLDVPANGTGNRAPSCDAGGPYSGVAGQPVAMNGGGSSDPGGSITSYAWNFGDGNTGSGVTPSHTYAAAGLYNVSLTVTDNCGATSPCGTTANIAPPNQAPHCNAGGPYFGGVNQPVQFNGTGSNDPDGTIVAYNWNFGDGSTGTGPTPTHAYNHMDVFTVSLRVIDDDQAQSCCQTTCDIGATAVELISFTATSNEGAVHLAWRTGAEENHAGFRVLRAADGSDAYAVASGSVLVRDDDADHAYAFEDHAVEAGRTYLYRLVAIDLGGQEQLFAPLRVTVSRSLPPALVLHPSRPNPFNPSTSIAFDLPAAAAATVRIYGPAGHLVRTLAEREAFAAGSASLVWDGRDDTGTGMPSGVYVVRLEIGARVLTEKIVLAR